MSSPLSTLIGSLKENEYAEVYSPCDQLIIKNSAELLIKSGHAWTAELSDLFQICNGFFFNGLYLFSLQSQEVQEYLDLFVQNAQWNIAERLPECVLFGRSDEEVYVYNGAEKKYQILDFTAWDEYYAFPTLAELLEFVISERL
jgi:hypothetical protein